MSDKLVAGKRCCTVCDAQKVCHICGAQTLLACSDCRLNLSATVYVCGKRECREAHDRVCSGQRTSMASLTALNRPMLNRAQAIEAYVRQFNRTEYPSTREAFSDGWDACYMQRPQRARVGQLEVGATEDRREVAINAPYTPDNGTGFVHFAFTPRQAIDLAETLFRKAADCLPEAQGKKEARRHSTLVKMAITRATTLRDTHMTNPDHTYIVALADEYLALQNGSEYEQVGVLRKQDGEFTTYELADGEPVYVRKRVE